jgi:hypothetical protein
MQAAATAAAQEAKIGEQAARQAAGDTGADAQSRYYQIAHRCGWVGGCGWVGWCRWVWSGGKWVFQRQVHCHACPHRR